MITGVWTMGETMISLRADAPVGSSPRWTTHVAGAESNVAVGLARLGHTVRWVSRVGDDEFGRLIVRELRAEGVDVAATVDPGRPTGHLFLTPTSFASAVDYHRSGSAASALDPDLAVADLDATGPGVVVLSGITPALGEGPRRATLEVAARARQLGATVVLDANHRTRLWSPEQASRVLSHLVEAVDVLVGSPDEIGLVAPTAESALDLGPTMVIEKLGAAGARLVSREGSLPGPTTSVDVVDPVGAGDAFTAGVVSSLIDRLSPERLLARANLMGAACVGHRGDWEGLPRRFELDAAERGMGSSDVNR
ncbi:sugar kinase [Aestuariimicrobium sp. T2.26MG-19.2B]|uniref:sugar kinase n=1 Tax=Aestuariimicrobium sp. T2.26MG-19.2B TaxID=3040679 RepID=UPI002477C1E0|nr:sugar kinase [Aestuariimicrobium sp. T2.26MG-19.2B]CAI9401485.1 2-dehydro-3-deoxygluconokinase [Aestuariimicrobium sp. T2.26MG-19.2B]